MLTFSFRSTCGRQGCQGGAGGQDGPAGQEAKAGPAELDATRVEQKNTT